MHVIGHRVDVPGKAHKRGKRRSVSSGAESARQLAWRLGLTAETEQMPARWMPEHARATQPPWYHTQVQVLYKDLS